MFTNKHSIKQRTRATVDQTKAGSRYIRIRCLRINILSGKFWCSRHLTDAMLPKLVFPLKVVVPEECVAGGTRVVAGSGSKWYVCSTKAPSRNLGRNLFPCVVFFPLTNQRVQLHNGDSWASCSLQISCPMGRCLVNPTTPLGPDQVNVLLFFPLHSAPLAI
jgi:hypothetical protein